MRNRAFSLSFATIVAATTFCVLSNAQASTFETLSGTVKSVDPSGIIQLHDGSSLVFGNDVKIDGVPTPGGRATLTYSADENGYTYETAKFESQPSGTAKD